MAIKGLKRNIFQRILGICATKEPLNPECWTAAGGAITVNLEKASELAAKGGAIRLEGKGMPKRVLVFRDDSGALRAFDNKCAHKGRRIDPVSGEGIVQCCSVNAAAYDYQGKKIEGPGEGQLSPLAVKEEGGKAVIQLAT
jgi:nitrite reductase/ring-hydroxylating ferredoxin subunit